MKRLLLVSNDEVGPQMAGPGIRYFQFARELSKTFEVTLVAPTSRERPLPELEVLSSADWRGSRFLELAKRHDVVVAQTLRYSSMKALARSDVRVVYDLYDPYFVSNLFLHGRDEVSPRLRRVAYRAPNLLQQIALATGSAFVCASERQRDLWIGMLEALGRIDPTVSETDPSLRDLIDVVPFGLENEPPRKTNRALKGVIDGIGPDDHVLLWGGGIWNWFDPLTPIRAVHELAKQRDDVKLYFLGVRHPNPAVPEMAMASRAVELAKDLGVYERHVFFNFGWVPYADRANFLLDSDVGVSSHLDTVETRFAFRTRLLDYFWAGLPTITTEGDVLAELVADENLGRTVRCGDVDGWVTAIEELVDGGDETARIRRNVEVERRRFEWPVVVEPLARLADIPGAVVKSDWAVSPMVYRYMGLALQHVLLRTGGTAGLREAYRLFRRPRVP